MPTSNDRERQVLEAVVDRASKDPVFRKLLLTDPRGTIDANFGVRIPETFRIRFIERDPDLDALIVLPDLQVTNAELSDQDLEAVTGGAQQSAWAGELGPISVPAAGFILNGAYVQSRGTLVRRS